MMTKRKQKNANIDISFEGQNCLSFEYLCGFDVLLLLTMNRLRCQQKSLHYSLFDCLRVHVLWYI